MPSLDEPFNPFAKMPESSDRWRIDERAWRSLRKEDWAVTEKIHGANFVVATDGRRARFAKRKEWLAADEDFFGHRLLADALTAQAIALFHRARDERMEVERLVLYGELFGGAYPHPDVPPRPGVQAVQTGVWYGPEVMFALFDLAFEHGRDRRHLAIGQMVQWAEAAGLRSVRPLFVGPFEKAIAYPLEFESTWPARLGLPPLPAGNLAEGVVMRTAKPIEVPTAAGPVRPVLKRKIARFAEDDRYHRAEKPTPQPVDRDAETALALVMEEADHLATANRLANAVSKLGRLDRDDAEGRARLLSAVGEDILDQLREGSAELMVLIPPDGQARLRAHVDRLGAELIRAWRSGH